MGSSTETKFKGKFSKFKTIIQINILNGLVIALSTWALGTCASSRQQIVRNFLFFFKQSQLVKCKHTFFNKHMCCFGYVPIINKCDLLSSLYSLQFTFYKNIGKSYGGEFLEIAYCKSPQVLQYPEVEFLFPPNPFIVGTINTLIVIDHTSKPVSIATTITILSY